MKRECSTATLSRRTSRSSRFAATSQRTSHPWVLDFGLAHFRDRKAKDGAAKNAAGDDPRQPSPTDRRTQGVGTPPYMAPEIVMLRATDGGKDDSCRVENKPAFSPYADVWSLGVTLYELLTLRLPFPGQSEAEMARKIVSDPPDRLNGSIPRELQAICLKALEKEPDKRYASAAELAADLHRWLGTRPTMAGEAAIEAESAPRARRGLGADAPFWFLVPTSARGRLRRRLAHSLTACGNTRREGPARRG